MALVAGLGLMAGPASALRYGSTASFAAGDSPGKFEVQDLNGDGHLDVAVANFHASTVTVLLGDGAGSLTFSAAYSVAVNGWTKASSLAVHDFDENGTPDIAVTVPFGAGGIVILFGDGTGIFPSRSAIDAGIADEDDQPEEVAAGDLNGDGHADLVTCNSHREDMSVLLGRGDGTFETPVLYPIGDPFVVGNGSTDVDLADLDGDGDLDVAVPIDFSGNPNSLMVRLGNGDGTLGEARSYSGVGIPFFLDLGDVDDDGDIDAVLANGPHHWVGILRNDGTGAFGSPSRTPVGFNSLPFDVVIADLDEDGRVDIATAALNADAVFVLKGNGDGTFPTQSSFAVGDGPSSLAVGDFDEDGSPDLVSANTGSDNITLLLRPDADDDGLSYGEEGALGTDPFDADTDDDDLADGEEITQGTDPLDADSDDDTLGDGDEIALGTNPLDGDSDDDSLGDAAEVAMGTDPLDADSDDDGLSDGTEDQIGTDPLDADSDDNGIPDGEDPDRIADIVQGLPDSALNSGGNRTALMARLSSIEDRIADGDFAGAIAQLENLRQRVDGCTPESPDPDSNDWITDAESQMEVRALIDALIALLEAA